MAQRKIEQGQSGWVSGILIVAEKKNVGERKKVLLICTILENSVE